MYLHTDRDVMGVGWKGLTYTRQHTNRVLQRQNDAGQNSTQISHGIPGSFYLGEVDNTLYCNESAIVGVQTIFAKPGKFVPLL
jgi:hypothetical protein